MHLIDEIIQSAAPTPIPNALELLPFAHVVWPWINVAHSHLSQKCCRYELLSDEAYISLQYALAKRLSDICTSAMHFEMKIHSSIYFFDQSSPSEKYTNFVNEKLLRPEALRFFFEEYGELSKLVVYCMQFWIDRTHEFFLRLEKDLDILSRVFNQGQSLGKAISIKVDLGDTHLEGSFVASICFESRKTVFYKPKCTQIVHQFNAFIGKLNELGLRLRLQTYISIPMENYGWEESIEFQPCTQSEQVKKCYERMGMQLCLIYLFHGIDFHYENMIVSGENPVLIDLEALFHSSLHRSNESNQHSVKTTGFLPNFSEMNPHMIDLSGISGGKNYHCGRWKDVNSEEMKYEFFDGDQEDHKNQVVLKGEKQLASNFLSEIVSGFTEIYQFIQKNLVRLKEEELILNMSKCKVRTVLCTTKFYRYILDGLKQPVNLRDKKLASQFLDSSLSQRQSLIPSRIIEEEKKMLLQGDIPSFHTTPCSTDLFVSTQLVSRECLESRAIDRVIKRLDQMNFVELDNQLNLIKQSFLKKT